MNELEQILQEREQKKENERKKITQRQINKTHFGTANKNTDLFGFIQMIGKVLEKAMPNVTFVPDEGKKRAVEPMSQIDNAYISYRVLERTSPLEKKPRLREDINDPDDNGNIGTIYGKKFKCKIEFNIIASEYSIAEEVMSDFEDLMFLYTGYFKKNGVVELIFDKQLTDEYYDYLRETLSVRNLIYSVDIEKLTVISIEKMKNFDVFMQESNDKEENR